MVVFIHCRGTGIFECDVSLPEGRHEYKLLVDGQWKHDQTQVIVVLSYGVLSWPGQSLI